ncbi:MAG: T9SS type A sorting domain-containing protein, partial [Bacteroidetes bacterium]|nr:T9SS type A sorting domain-containing protein [Bacteroidota bacterium]
EYLAEISEAFFGRNDYYPFTRSDLVSHDPKGYALLMDLFVNSTSTAVEQLPEDSLLSIYPNPAQDVLRFDSIEAGRVLIYDTTGRVVLSQDVGVGISSIDISTLATGLYLVRLGDGIHDSLHKRTQKIIVAR